MFSLMGNETRDIVNDEQLVICLRWVDKNVETHEEFIRLRPLSSVNAENIFLILQGVLLSLELCLFEGKAPCYVGAARMIGAKNGALKILQCLNPKVFVVHCST